jgi:hypothetical protein
MHDYYILFLMHEIKKCPLLNIYILNNKEEKLTEREKKNIMLHYEEVHQEPEVHFVSMYPYFGYSRQDYHVQLLILLY